MAQRRQPRHDPVPAAGGARRAGRCCGGDAAVGMSQGQVVAVGETLWPSRGKWWLMVVKMSKSCWFMLVNVVERHDCDPISAGALPGNWGM